MTDKTELSEDSNILEGIIRFGDETVKEIMTSRLDMLDLDIHTPYKEVLQCIVDNAYSRIPVYESSRDKIKGILYIKDLLPHLNKAENFRWQSLIRPAYFVPETKMIDDLLRDFQANKIHIAIVVDEFGGTSGLVTMEDIIEEIVGEIRDEYDEEERTYAQLDDYTWVFEAKTQLIDFYKITKVEDNIFDKVVGDADTLAGLLLELKGEFPVLHGGETNITIILRIFNLLSFIFLINNSYFIRPIMNHSSITIVIFILLSIISGLFCIFVCQIIERKW